MRRISARTLLGMSTEQLWESLWGDFVLVFDDGEIQTNHRETCYSSYAWDFLREFPATPVLVKHHVADVLNGRLLGSNTHLELLASVVWDVFDAYEGTTDANGVTVNPTSEVVTLDRLAKRTYEIVNHMYNDLSYRLEEYVVSLDITHFVDMLDHPGIIEAKKHLYAVPLDKVTDKMIGECYEKMGEVIKNDPTIRNNPLAKAARSGTVKFDQLLQCVGPRGKVTDIDSNQFDLPILRSFTEGYRRFRDTLVESRSAAKSLIFSKTPLQQAEYFSRRLQLMSMNIQNLHRGDCGTHKYIQWQQVKKKDLKRLAGKYFLDEDANVLRAITGKETHLIGRTLKLRSVMCCAHPDPVGVCSTCFGTLAKSVPEFTNIGHMCCMLLTEKSSQSVLSVKHLDSSATIEAIVLGQDDKMFLRVGTDDNSYLIADRLKGVKVKLVLAADSIPNINDINEIPNVDDLTISRFSEVQWVGVQIEQRGHVEGKDVLTEVGGRMASMTHELLHHIRKVGFDINSDNNYVIDMTDWDWSKPILALPLRHFNMSDHSRDIARMLESSVRMMQERDKTLKPNDALQQLYDLVNSKLDVNLTVLDVVLHEARIVSAERGDYALPKPWTDEGFGVMSMSMLHRSLSAAMAFEDHRDTLVNPVSYISRNRLDHPFDVCVSPEEVLRGYPQHVYA
jgi:hypothetical protein